jgi:hypothetical protein
MPYEKNAAAVMAARNPVIFIGSPRLELFRFSVASPVDRKSLFFAGTPARRANNDVDNRHKQAKWLPRLRKGGEIGAV